MSLIDDLYEADVVQPETVFPLDVNDIANEINFAVIDWPGNCHYVATLILRHLPVKGMRLARGHWHGPVGSESVYNHSPCQHSWLVLADGRILDPLRWAFSGKEEPVLYIGDNDFYDEGSIELGKDIRQFSMPIPGQKDIVTTFLEKADKKHRIAIADALDENIDNDFDKPEIINNLAMAIRHALNDTPEHLRRPQYFFETLNVAGMRSLVKIDIWNRYMRSEDVFVSPYANRYYTLPERERLSQAELFYEILDTWIDYDYIDDLEGFFAEHEYNLDYFWSSLDSLKQTIRYNPYAEGFSHISSQVMNDLVLAAYHYFSEVPTYVVRIERMAQSKGYELSDLRKLFVDAGNRVGFDLAWR